VVSLGGVDEIVLKLERGDSFTTLNTLKPSNLTYIKWVKCTVCKS
jgi:hypothetical protein